MDHSSLCFFIKDFIIFRPILGLQQNWEEGTKMSHVFPYVPHMHIINILCQSATYFLQDEHTLTNHNHPTFIVNIIIHSMGSGNV